MSTYRWILFDADHTLFDFDRASEEALGEVLSDHGFDWQQAMYSDYKRINVQCWQEHEQGIINRDTLVYERFRRYFDFMQLDLDPVATQKKYLHALGRKPYLMPGAEEIIEWLLQHKRLGYITNGMTEVQRIRLEMIGWHQKFEVIVIAGEIGHSKPHAGYFNHVHEALNQPDKNEVLVIGDSLTADIEGAQAFGYRTCWYNPDNHACDISQHPDYTISHFDQLKVLLAP